QDNTYLFTSDMSSTYKVLPDGDIKISKNETQPTDSDIKGQFVPIKAQTVAEYLKIISNAKDVSEKYCLLTNQSWDLSSQLCTQSQDYLEKSVFVGDSIFQGFTFYKLQNANRVLSKVGVGSRNILLQTLENDGKEYLLQEFLKKKQPQYVYIMLGLNDINMIETQEYSANFKEIIALIKTTVPDADIVLCSMTPIRKMSFSSPKWIRKYNLVLQQIAQETKGVYYLDMFDYLSVNGILANKYSAGDGIHFTKKTYQMLVDYILIHQVRPYEFDNPDILDILHNTPLIIDEEKIKAVDEYSKNKGQASPMAVAAVESAAP
ncbi:MAG: SGNH/GDSL hydrolase family protein, partial [Oscillospiraceae bacterium]